MYVRLLLSPAAVAKAADGSVGFGCWHSLGVVLRREPKRAANGNSNANVGRSVRAGSAHHNQSSCVVVAAIAATGSEAKRPARARLFYYSIQARGLKIREAFCIDSS